MSYTSYNAYIVQNNGAVLLAIAIINHISFTFNIKPLTYLLSSTIILLFEFILSTVCVYNIWSVSKGFVLPYINKAKIPYSEYLFVPGPATLSLWKFLCSNIRILLGKKPLEPAKPPTPTPAEPKLNPFFLNFLAGTNKPTNTNASTFTATEFKSNIISNSLSDLTNRKEPITSNALDEFLTQDATAAKLAAYSNPNNSFSGAIPKLQFSSCIKPPLEPSAHRERTLWYLNRTPEIVDDFRIEQILAFRKNWNKFNDRLSSIYYDKMTNILHEKIFKPLAKSIEHFNTVLTPSQQTVAKCSSATIAYSLVIPGFNNNSAFTISEVVDFITLNSYVSEEAKQYVIDRVLELSHSNKLAAYRFTPITAGMPTDSEIIMHALTTYLTIKEPRAIPPLVPADVDLFKFLLVYIYITPELDHWKIFK